MLSSSPMQHRHELLLRLPSEHLERASHRLAYWRTL
jgi:hypothetical protein